MKLISAIIFGIFLGIIPAYSNDLNFIPWSEERKLEWDDFLGTPGEFPSAYTRPSYDTTAFTWGESKLDDFDYHIVNSHICQYQIIHVDAVGYFNKKQSWTTDKAKEDPNALNHEQGHFDIIEVYARQIESRLLLKIFECPGGIYNEGLIDKEIKKKAFDIGDKAQERHDEYDEDIKKTRGHSQVFLDKEIRRDLDRYQVYQNNFSSDDIPTMTVGYSHEQIECKQGWYVMAKHSNDKMVCVTPASALVLEERGWGKIIEVLQRYDY